MEERFVSGMIDSYQIKLGANQLVVDQQTPQSQRCQTSLIHCATAGRDKWLCRCFSLRRQTKFYKYLFRYTINGTSWGGAWRRREDSQLRQHINWHVHSEKQKFRLLNHVEEEKRGERCERERESCR